MSTFMASEGGGGTPFVLEEKERKKAAIKHLDEGLKVRKKLSRGSIIAALTNGSGWIIDDAASVTEHGANP